MLASQNEDTQKKTRRGFHKTLINSGKKTIKNNLEQKLDVVKPSIYENIFEFARNSSMHGLKFIGDDRLSTYERGFFFISFTVALLLSSNFIYDVYRGYNATPVIISINPVSTYINEIPFPAITICNMNQALASRVKGIDNKSMEYTMLRTLCGRNPNIGDKNGTKDWSLFQKFIVNVAQPCHQMLIACRFGSTAINCSDLFRTVITDEGVCCTFNLVDTQFMFKSDMAVDHLGPFNPPNITAVRWSPESGYKKPLPRRFYPRPAAGVGKEMGLSIVLDAQVAEYYCSTTNGPGFKALLHNPAEIPDIAEYGFTLQVGHEIGIVITPQIDDASEVLRNVERKYRQCMFSNEAQLRYYSTYTRRNCEMECEARLHRERCNCVQYYMPHVSKNISVCSLSDMECSNQVQFRTHETTEEIFQCSEECVPACFELKFTTEKYSSRLSHNQFLISDEVIQHMTEDYTAGNIVNAHFYYVERAFRSQTKQQFIGFTEFLSSIGGLLGLFLGFSVLSIMEILYYIFVRPFFALKRFRKSIKYKQLTEIKQVGTYSMRQASNMNNEEGFRPYKRSLGFGVTPITITTQFEYIE